MDLEYWEQRYQSGETGWNTGNVTPPMKYIIDHLNNKSLRILIPGCGFGWEAEYLVRQGFKNIYLVDGAQTARDQFLKRLVSFPSERFTCGDFFKITGKFDLILEQTFLSALQPDLWQNYAKKMAELLGDGGFLRGVVFTRPKPGSDGPPFWSDIDGYKQLFIPYFSEVSLAPCTISLSPRMGREAIIQLKK